MLGEAGVVERVVASERAGVRCGSSGSGGSLAGGVARAVPADGTPYTVPVGAAETPVAALLAAVAAAGALGARSRVVGCMPTTSGTMSSATMLMILISGLMAGPAVSL